MERFDNVDTACFTSDGQGLWSPVSESASLLWNATTGAIVFAPNSLSEEQVRSVQNGNKAPTIALPENSQLFRQEQAQTFDESYSTLANRHRNAYFPWSFKVADQVGYSKFGAWRQARPYRFLFALNHRLVLIEEAKDFLPFGLLIDLDTGKDVARIKEGVLVADDMGRLESGIWLADSPNCRRPRVLFLNGRQQHTADALIGADVTAVLKSPHGSLLVGTVDGRLYKCTSGSDLPTLIGQIPDGPVRAIAEVADGQLVVSSDIAVSFLSPVHREGSALSHPGAIGDISADGTMVAIVTQGSLSVAETLSGAIAWSIQKSFDRVLFNCEGSSIFCAAGLKARWKTLQEFDALAGLPLDPPGDRDFRNMLTNSPAVRFGSDEYITTSSQQSSFDWLAGNTESGNYCFRGAPNANVNHLSWAGRCFPGLRSKTSVLIESSKAKLTLQNGETAELPLSNLRNLSDVHVLFGPNDAEVLIADIDGVVRCLSTETGELKWQQTSPLEFAAEDASEIPSRATSSVLLVDGHVSILDKEAGQLITLEVLSRTLIRAELSSDAQTVLTLGLDGIVEVWSARDGRRIIALEGPEKICLAKFSPCGKFFATADSKGCITLHISETGNRVWQISTDQPGIKSVIPMPENSGIRFLANGYVETWQIDESVELAQGPQRIRSMLSAHGWPLRFISDLSSAWGLDERTLAGLSRNGSALDNLRPLFWKDKFGRPIARHIPNGPMRTVHRWLRPGLEELRVQECNRLDLPSWRNTSKAFAAHSSATGTLSLKLDAYPQCLGFGWVFAWMTSGPLQMGDDAATLLSRILTHSDYLAMSSRSAALIGELITIDLTERLVHLGNRHGVIITRFADRIFISGDEVPAVIASVLSVEDGELAIPGLLLSETVSRSGFRLEPFGRVESRMNEPASV